MDFGIGLTLCMLTGSLFGLIFLTPGRNSRKSASDATPAEKERLSRRSPFAVCGLTVLVLVMALFSVGCNQLNNPYEREHLQSSREEPEDTTAPSQEEPEDTTAPSQEEPEDTTAPFQEEPEDTTAPSQEEPENTTALSQEEPDSMIEGTTENGYTYKINADKTECTITGYTGEETVLEIPNTVDDVPVTVIGEKAFSGLENIIRVTFRSNLKEIQDQAFAGCSSLKGFVSRSKCTAAASAFDNCSALRYAILLDADATLDGWVLPNDLRTYQQGMETGIGKLDSIPMISIDGVVYGATEDKQAVVLYIPGDITETTIVDKFEFESGNVYPVKWIYKDAMDQVDPSTKITLPAETLFPYEMWNKADWLFNAEGGNYTCGDCTASQCWYLSCVACASINEKRPANAPEILPNEQLLRAAMLRAEELVISDDIQWRPDDLKWNTILDDFEISCRYAVTWKNTMPAYDWGVSAYDLSDIFTGLTEAYAPMVEEWQEYYTDLCIGLSYDEANKLYQLSCLIIVE